jgi:multisubunit Na+/H+ antiporter MnhB subunit
MLPMLALAAGLGYAVLSLPQQAPGLQAAVAEQLDKSGVINPVTAVLLNFRGYDTLLEMVVLLLALLGVWSLGPQSTARPAVKPDLILDALTRLLVPLMMLVAAYLLWAGAHAPGGAFQAGAVLGAAGVLLVLSGWRPPTSMMQWPLRVALLAGVLTFLAVAVLTLQSTGQLLEYPLAQAGALIFIIEAAATVSIAVTLAALFLAATNAAEGDQ